MASFEFLAIVVSVLGLAASITYYALVLSNANKTQKAQLFMSIYQITIDEEMNKKWYDAMEMNTENFNEVRVAMHTLFQKYNGIGHLMMQGLLDVDSAYHYSEGYRAVLLWKKWGEHILAARERAFNPDYMDGFQNMAEKMMNYREEKGLPNKLLPHFQN